MCITGIFYSLNIIHGFLSTQYRANSGISTYQVVGDTFGSETTGMLSSAYRHVKLHQGADMYPDRNRYQVPCTTGTCYRVATGRGLNDRNEIPGLHLVAGNPYQVSVYRVMSNVMARGCLMPDQSSNSIRRNGSRAYFSRSTRD